MIRSRLFKISGILLLALGLVLVITTLSNIETPEPEITRSPTATPLPPRILTPLQERIIGARERTEAIDIRSSELSLPQVDYGFELDEVKR